MGLDAAEAARGARVVTLRRWVDRRLGIIEGSPVRLRHNVPKEWKEAVDRVLLAIERAVWGFTWRDLFEAEKAKHGETERRLDAERQRNRSASRNGQATT